MLVNNFGEPDMGIEIFFEKYGTAEYRKFNFETWTWGTCCRSSMTFKGSFYACTFMPWLSDSLNLSSDTLRLLLMCLGQWVEYVLPGVGWIAWGGVCLEGMGIGQDYYFSVRNPLSK